jgi:hypothetical protein
VIRSVLLAILIVSCVSHGDAVLEGHIVAGPTCPVETEPPDPNCLPEPVSEALVTLRYPNGSEFSTMSDEDGSFRIVAPAGEPTVVFGEVAGLMGTLDSLSVSLDPGETVDLGEIAYDTGIR